MTKSLVELFAMAGFADLASIITVAGIIFMATKKGRAWLNKPAIDRSDELMELCNRNARDTKRTELLLIIYMHPEDVEIVEKAYDEYKKLGGNSYIDRVVHEWREMYGKGAIQQKINK